MGSGRAPTAARQNLNEVAAAVGTDLRVNDDRVIDSDHSVRSVEDLVYTEAVTDSPALRTPARFGRPDRGRRGSGIDDPDDFEISGYREINTLSVEDPVEEPVFDSKYRVVREGDEVRITITIEDLNHPAEIRQPLTESMAYDWEILEEAPDVEAWDRALQEVVLGEVTPEDVAGDQTVTKQMVAIAGYSGDVSPPPGIRVSAFPDYTLNKPAALASVGGQLAVRYFTPGGSDERTAGDSIYVIPEDR
jgi:hypothetical protein